MKYGLVTTVILLLLIITNCQLFAQSVDGDRYAPDELNSNRPWSVGASGGILTTYILFGNIQKLDFTSPDEQAGYNINVKYQLSRSLGLQADILMGKLQADHAKQTFPDGAYIYSQFDTRLNWSASLSANFILAHINVNQKDLIQPYVTLGGGMLNYTYQLHVYNRPPYAPNTSSDLFIPIGLGLKIDLARGVNLDIGYQLNFVSSDNLDGYIYGSNNDKFSYAHIGLEFAFGNSSKPHRGIRREHKPGKGKYIPWAKNLNAPVVVQPSQVDSAQIKHDHVKSELDSANARLQGLTVDSDGDGVPDVKDKCPNTPAGTKVDSSGCPVPLPVIKPEVKTEIAEQDKKTVQISIQNLDFFVGTSIIHGYSFDGLDKVADLLIKKNLHLKLEGYTDNTGKPDANLKLSKERADAIKIYLIGRGVNPDRIETAGYGATHPIASNKTAAGRRLNRRVEFTLF